MPHYRDMDPEQAIAYLEKRLADVNRANQSMVDTARTFARDLARLSVRLEDAAQQAHNEARPPERS